MVFVFKVKSLIILLLPIVINGDVVTLKNGNKIYGLVQKFNKNEGIILEVDTGLVTIPPDSILQYDISKQPKINYEYKEYKYPNQRSKEEINSVVMKNLDKLKKLHLNFLKKKIIVEGKITVRFSVDGLGNVIDAQIVESDISIFNFNEAVLDIVRNYEFSKSGNEKDITEIIYPFIFSIEKGNNTVRIEI